MNDDLFSRLFELFDQPGPINWKLASEVAKHLSGERVPVEPWAGEEYREMARLAEFKVGEVAPFPVVAAPDVLPLDPRSWAERHLEAYGYLVEPMGDAVTLEGPAAALAGQLAPALIGLQVGSLVGSVAAWALAGFDTGLPPDRLLPLTVIVPHVEAFATNHGLDPRQARLWVVANEVAFRAASGVTWVPDRIGELVAALAAAIEINPAALSGLVGSGTNPDEIERALAESGGIEALLGGEQAAAPRAELEAFLATLAGCARLVARRSVSDLLPEFDRITALRDEERSNTAGGLSLGIDATPTEPIQAGDLFCQEVERRYGEGALTTLWSEPWRMPSADELRDPVAWAARVLLDGWTLSD